MTRMLLIGCEGQLGVTLRARFAATCALTAVGRSALDVTDADAVVRLVDAVRPQIVVNASAYTAVDRAESEPAIAHAVNARAPGVIADAAARVGALVVHYSTDYVFDGTKSGPWREDDPPHPVSVYGRTKLEGEQAVAAANPRHLVLRTSWVYAAHGKNFLLTMLRLARERDELRVVDDQHGAPTWTEDIAAGTAAVLAGADGDPAPGVYHMTAAGETTWCGFARAILRLAGSPTPVRAITTRDYPTPATRPANSVLSNAKLHATFGVALPDWETGLAGCMRTLAAR